MRPSRINHDHLPFRPWRGGIAGREGKKFSQRSVLWRGADRTARGESTLSDATVAWQLVQPAAEFRALPLFSTEGAHLSWQPSFMQCDLCGVPFRARVSRSERQDGGSDRHSGRWRFTQHKK